MPINCPKCKTPQADNIAFCSSCGLPLGGGAAAADSGMGRMIPKKNPASLIAYYGGIFSCVCWLGGPVVLYFGLKALRDYRANPAIHGKTHAWVGIILGGLSTLALIVYGGSLLFAAATGRLK